MSAQSRAGVGRGGGRNAARAQYLAGDPRCRSSGATTSHYRTLAEAEDDAFLPDLAASLNNRSNGLAGLGRHQEALGPIEEAVGIRRMLAEADPDAFLPDLARSLNNLSNRLADLGQEREAHTAARGPVAFRI